jgi:D-alanine--(R)-lactate ligase
MDKLQVAVIFGGASEEHPVSVKSAREVARNLDAQKYEPHFVGITRSGEWMLCEGPDADLENGNGRRAILSPDRSVHGLLV